MEHRTIPRLDRDVSVIGLGFWFGMIKRSFKVKTTV